MNIPSAAPALLIRLRRIIGWAVVGAGLALASGCSTIKLGYNNLDDITAWWLDGYVDFSDEQEARVREDLKRLHRWHRKEELPKYVALLQSLEAAASRDMTPAQACAYFDKVRERMETVAGQAEPAVVTLATSLAPRQLQHLQRKYDKNNAKYRKDWMDIGAQEVVDKRAEQFAERGEMVYGKLDDAQLALVRRQLQASAFDPVRAFADRQRRQRDAMQTLKDVSAPGMPLADAKAALRVFLERMLVPAAPAERAWQQSMIDENCRAISALHNSTNAGQREVAARRLRAWQRDLRELSAQP